MQNLKSWKRLSLIFVLLSLLVACGQKGDLYLPDEQSSTSWVE